MSLIGVDIEEVSENYIKIEYNPNRPDLGTLIGLSRAYKGITREETGLITYKVYEGDYLIKVDSSVNRVRPYIAGVVIKNVPMDEDLLLELIAYQEDLHQGIGRKRRKVAIGIHNLDVIRFPLEYRALSDENYKFIPLNRKEEMSIGEILTSTETGKKYGYIIADSKLYPLIFDHYERVLSFPPIINANFTKVTPNTKNLFIDVTGTDFNAVMNTVNLLSTYFHDLNAEVWRLEVIYPNTEKIVSPRLETNETSVDKELINKLLGLNLSDSTIVECLKACRLDAVVEKNVVKVKYPPYRVDLLHPVDIVEEVAIGFGYENMVPELPEVNQIGQRNLKLEFASIISELIIGMGFQEVMTFTLSNIRTQFVKMNLEPINYIKVLKPKSGDLEIFRKWIIPNLLTVLRQSQKERLPQKIFEIGKVAYKVQNDVIEELHLALTITYNLAGYSDVKAVIDTLFDILELNFKINETSHPSFIYGRVGEITVGSKNLGIIGEIHPSVLESFSIENPISALEINLDALYEVYKQRLR